MRLHELFKRRAARLAATALVATTAFGTASLASGCRGGRFGNVISRSQQVQIGQETAGEVERQQKVLNDPEVNARMQRIADRIFPLARKDFDVPYTVKVIDSKDVNAFALPGGPIYFYKGLIDLAGSDDEIASVLGHEAAHIVKQHSAKQISDAQFKNTLLSIATQGKSDLIRIASSLALTVDQLKYSRGDEGESDEVGFRYLTQAGYDPDAMAGFFRRLEAKEGRKGGGPSWLRSHPVTSSRVRAAEARAQAYKQSGQTAGAASAR